MTTSSPQGVATPVSVVASGILSPASVVDTAVLPQRLRSARRVRQLTQPEVAKRSGLSQSQISRLESGQTSDPAFSTVAAVARALGVSLDAIAAPDGDEFLRQINRDEDALDNTVAVGLSTTTGAPVAVARFLQPHVATPHMLIVGARESGAPAAAKLDLIRWTQQQVPAAVVDDRGEYRAIAEAHNGRVIALGAGDILNVMDFSAPAYGPNSLASKVSAVTRFLMGLIGSGAQTKQQRAAVEDIVWGVYRRRGFSTAAFSGVVACGPTNAPTLGDVHTAATHAAGHEDGRAQLARILADALAPYVGDGAYAELFDAKTTVSDAHSSPLVVFDLSAVPAGARRAAASVAVEQTRAWWVTRPADRGDRRLLYITNLDELTGDPYTGEQAAGLVRRARDCGVGVTLIAHDTNTLTTEVGQEIAAKCAHQIVLRPDTVGRSVLTAQFGLTGHEADLAAQAPVGRALLVAGEKKSWVDVQGAATPDELALL